MSTLRVATLNVWGHPDWIGGDAALRMGAVGDRVAELDVDVLAIQEVWTEEVRALLLEGGRRAGLTSVWHNHATLGGSGLLVMSRLQLRQPLFQPFTLGGLPHRIDHGDFYSGKGFVTVRVVTDVGEVVLLDTHLQAQYEPDAIDRYRGQRVAQIVELSEGLAAESGPVVALGDFNITETDLQYEILVGLTGLRDTAVELDRRQVTLIADHPYRGADGGEERIDYVFVRDGAGVRVSPRSVRREFDVWLDFGGRRGAYSDHAGLVAELDLSPGTPRASEAGPAPSVAALRDAELWLSRGSELARRRRREQRAFGGAGLAGACAFGAVSLSRRVGRRRLLKLGGVAAALASTAVAGGMWTLSERFVGSELEGFATVQQTLQTLRRRSLGSV